MLSSDILKAEFGSYTTLIKTERKGENTPVRRSYRTSKLTKVEFEDTSDDTIKKEERDWMKTSPAKEDTDSNLGDHKQKESKKVLFVDESTSTGFDLVDELCTVFQTVLKVDDASLKTKVTDPQRLSPMPKQGRCTLMCEDRHGVLSPVKRSVRKMTMEK